MMHRLFVALRPPAPIRAKLIGLMGGIVGARWQDDDQLHLTLRFIGEVDENIAEDVATALATVQHKSIEVALNGVGLFDRKSVIDTLWAGISPNDHLASLHKKIDHVMVKCGLPAESRAYLPHITLARLNRNSGPVEDFLAQQAGLTSETFRMDWFALYESSIGHGGAHYDLIARYPLTR
jgi:RNA 2',3'-cyclic 3'-phosphodiesterase